MIQLSGKRYKTVLTSGDSDLSYIIKKCQNIMARIVEVKDFLSNCSILPCSCEGFDYIDKDHQYIVGGEKGPEHKETIALDEKRLK